MASDDTIFIYPKIGLLVGDLCPHCGESKLDSPRVDWHYKPSPQYTIVRTTLDRHSNMPLFHYSFGIGVVVEQRCGGALMEAPTHQRQCARSVAAPSTTLVVTM